MLSSVFIATKDFLIASRRRIEGAVGEQHRHLEIVDFVEHGPILVENPAGVCDGFGLVAAHPGLDLPPEVRFGSKSDVAAFSGQVCFTPESGRTRSCAHKGIPFWAHP